MPPMLDGIDKQTMATTLYIVIGKAAMVDNSACLVLFNDILLLVCHMHSTYTAVIAVAPLGEVHIN